MEQPTISLDAEEIISEPQGEELENSTVEAETTESESSTDEAKAEATTEDEEPSEGEETEGESKDEPEETDTDQPKFETAEKRKETLQSEIRQLVSERNAIRQDIAAATAKVYQPQSAEDLIEQGVEPALARVEALEQRTQMAEFNAHVADLNASLNTEALQVMHDFPIFDAQSSEYNADLAQLAENIYTKAAGIKTDPQTGLVYDAAVLPYQIYQSIAQAHAAGASAGKVNGQRATEKMMAASETPTSAAPKAPKEDPFLRGFNLGR